MLRFRLKKKKKKKKKKNAEDAGNLDALGEGGGNVGVC